MAESSTGKVSSTYLGELVNDFKAEMDPNVGEKARKELDDLLLNQSTPVTLNPMKQIKIEELSNEKYTVTPNLVAVLDKCYNLKIRNTNNGLNEFITLIEKKTANEVTKKVMVLSELKKETDEESQKAKQSNDDSTDSTQKLQSITPQQKDHAEGTKEETPDITSQLKDDGDGNEPQNADSGTSPGDKTEAEVTTNETSSPALRQLLESTAVSDMAILSAAKKEYEGLLLKVNEKDTIAEAVQDDSNCDISTIEYILSQPLKEPSKHMQEQHEEAKTEYQRLIKWEQALQIRFPTVDFSKYTQCIVKTADDVPPFVRESCGQKLKEFLTELDRGVFTKHHTLESMWNEFARLQISHQHFILAEKAEWPDENTFIVIERENFFSMQEDLRKRTEEVEELSTRLSRFASSQLTEGNPNIADLSDTHRPTKIGEMFGLLYDDEWSEAFEALKPEEEDEDDIYPDVLETLQNIVMKSFEFATQHSEEQLMKFQTDMASIITASEMSNERKPSENTIRCGTENIEGQEMPVPEKIQTEEKMLETPEKNVTEKETPDKTDRNKMEEKAVEKPKSEFVSRLNHFAVKHSKEFIKISAHLSFQVAAEEFVRTELPKLLEREKEVDKRVANFAKKCVELCWFMRVQDPPMMLAALGKGDTFTTEEYAYHGRKGKEVEICVWPALFLYQNGPLVSKGHVLPKPKGKK